MAAPAAGAGRASTAIPHCAAGALSRLRQGRSPEQVARRLAREAGQPVISPCQSQAGLAPGPHPSPLLSVLHLHTLLK